MWSQEPGTAVTPHSQTQRSCLHPPGPISAFAIVDAICSLRHLDPRTLLTAGRTPTPWTSPLPSAHAVAGAPPAQAALPPC